MTALISSQEQVTTCCTARLFVALFADTVHLVASPPRLPMLSPTSSRSSRTR
jgi:hypothetical protein